MKIYFQMRKKIANEGLDFLFKTPISSDDSQIIYEDESDEDEYITWKPVEITVSQDFTSLEDEFDIKLHKTVVEYFTSYWFADLDGFYQEHYITLEPVLPNSEMSSFRESLKGYKENHGDRLKNIPIGVEGNGLLVVLENYSGIIQLEDFESGTLEPIAKNIQELIGNLRLKR
ncbi:SecY-interacting protein Syd [Solibacillus sp. FSL K6-1523]|uniref:SecY-interacting protein Syd n=1 Tax=Solibacillus sp. FSL K6-1523 TaxID=2921471 RepID=UPI0030F4D2DB